MVSNFVRPDANHPPQRQKKTSEICYLKHGLRPDSEAALEGIRSSHSDDSGSSLQHNEVCILCGGEEHDLSLCYRDQRECRSNSICKKEERDEIEERLLQLPGLFDCEPCLLGSKSQIVVSGGEFGTCSILRSERLKQKRSITYRAVFSPKETKELQRLPRIQCKRRRKQNTPSCSARLNHWHGRQIRQQLTEHSISQTRYYSKPNLKLPSQSTCKGQIRNGILVLMFMILERAIERLYSYSTSVMLPLRNSSFALRTLLNSQSCALYMSSYDFQNYQTYLD